MPRVITVDKNPAYPIAINELKNEKKLSKNVEIRQVKYLTLTPIFCREYIELENFIQFSYFFRNFSYDLNFIELDHFYPNFRLFRRIYAFP